MSRFTVIPSVYLIVQKDDRVLLLRRANTGYQDGNYAFPAGHLEGGESARKAAVRELKEEVGLKTTESDLRFVHVMHRIAEEGDHERVDFFFTVTHWHGEPYNAEPNKSDDVQWFPLDHLPAHTSPITTRVLQLIALGASYSDHNFPD